VQSQRTPAALLLLTCVAVGVPLAALALLARGRDISLDTLTRDPAAVGDLPFYTGALSSLGAMLWAAAAAICLFGARMAARGGASRRDGEFLRSAGLLSVLLGLDDLYLLHEQFGPGVLGLPDDALLLLYALLLAAVLLIYRVEILRGEWLLLGGGLALFAASLAIDLIVDEAPGVLFLEDTAKFLGIVVWLVYFWRAAGHAAAQGAPGPRLAA